MIHVRRHRRQTASGKTVTVRAHEREGDDGVREVPQWSRPASVSDFARPAAASEPKRDAGDWWDDGAAEPDDGMSPAFRAMVARNPSLGGEKFERLRALRESGYTGPVDQDGNPAPEDKAAAVRELREARAELERVSRGLREETEEYHAANRRVLEAEKHVSWWRR